MTLQSPACDVAVGASSTALKRTHDESIKSEDNEIAESVADEGPESEQAQCAKEKTTLATLKKALMEQNKKLAQELLTLNQEIVEMEKLITKVRIQERNQWAQKRLRDSFEEGHNTFRLKLQQDKNKQLMDLRSHSDLLPLLDWKEDTLT